MNFITTEKTEEEKNMQKDLIESIETFHEALRVSIRESGKMEKQFHLELKIDASQWTRITAGGANFPMDKLKKFQIIAQNNIPLEWLAYQSGYEIRIFPKTLEEKLAEAEAKIAEKDKKIEHYESLLFDMSDKAKLLKFNK